METDNATLIVEATAVRQVLPQAAPLLPQVRPVLAQVQPRNLPERAVAAPWAPRAELEKALCDLDRALAADPQSLNLQFMRAHALQALGRDLEARTAYVEILKRDAMHLGALGNLGRHLASTGNSAAARILLQQAVDGHPGDLASRVALGTLLLQAGELAAARGMFDEALLIAPADPLAHTGMAFVLEQLGDTERAAQHRREGFKGRTIIAQPYRGVDAPIPVILLASANGGNVPLERFLDDKTFQTWIVIPEFHDPAVALPAHRLIVNAIGDVDAVPAALRAAQGLLDSAPAPVVNLPAAIASTGRCENWRRLADIPGVVTPLACTTARAVLESPGVESALAERGLTFPLLLRSPGFHGGQHFLLLKGRDDLPAALAQLPGSELIAIQFIDTRDAAGKLRKYRVMMIDGALYPLHLAVARDWKVHYFSADMAGDPDNRAEDARFLDDMAGVLGERAMRTLERIQARLGLDYGGIDFALSPAGEVVVFEANATMVVCRPDADPRWSYRCAAVDRIDAAVRRMLLSRCAPVACGDALISPLPSGERGGGEGNAPRSPARTRHRPPGMPVPAQRAALSNELNFSAGPGALPAEVLQQTQQAVIALPETGLSVLGMSHRSAWFEDLLAEAEHNLRELLSIPQTHGVLFLQGGSSLQFSMIPMNFAHAGGKLAGTGGAAAAVTGPGSAAGAGAGSGAGRAPAHVRSGYWSAKAIEEARCVRPLQVAWDGAGDRFRRLPAATDLLVDPEAPYLHYISNETIEGLQFAHPPHLPGVPLIADMSSDFLSRPVDFRQHAMVYAHAQKNLGPAGVTVCVVERGLLERIPDGLPPMLDYRTHLKHRSNYNTPPVFGIYVLTLVTRWLRDAIGGIDPMARINAAKAGLLYGTLDRLSGVLQPHADARYRSAMNVSFKFRDARLDAQFLAAAGAAGFAGLEGHRSLGGIRASLYNAVSEAAVAQLCTLLADFAAAHG